MKTLILIFAILVSTFTFTQVITVKSMGNAMIQPTMYFNLRYVPLFYGPYWITEVSHNAIENGMMGKNFNSNFNGMLFMMPSRGEQSFWMYNCIVLWPISFSLFLPILFSSPR